jgi:hypothetical protein
MSRLRLMSRLMSRVVAGVSIMSSDESVDTSDDLRFVGSDNDEGDMVVLTAAVEEALVLEVLAEAVLEARRTTDGVCVTAEGATVVGTAALLADAPPTDFARFLGRIGTTGLGSNGRNTGAGAMAMGPLVATGGDRRRLVCVFLYSLVGGFSDSFRARLCAGVRDLPEADGAPTAIDVVAAVVVDTVVLAVAVMVVVVVVGAAVIRGATTVAEHVFVSVMFVSSTRPSTKPANWALREASVSVSDESSVGWAGFEADVFVSAGEDTSLNGLPFLSKVSESWPGDGDSESVMWSVKGVLRESRDNENLSLMLQSACFSTTFCTDKFRVQQEPNRLLGLS